MRGRAILNPREPRLPPGADEPVFEEPWQATAFAMTVALHERGVFSWSEWAEKLGAELKSGDAYYDCWMRALERVLAECGVAKTTEVDVVAAAWERAAHATP